MSNPFGFSILLAATLGFSSLAFAATGAQADTPAPSTSTAAASTSSGSMHHGKRHGMHHRGNHHGPMGMLDKLELTDTQQANIRQLMRDSMDQARPEMQALRQKREAYESATPGTSDYQAAASQLATAEANAARERVTREAALRTKVRGILTSEQRTQLASLRAERMAQMKNWRTEHARHPAATPAPASSTR